MLIYELLELGIAINRNYIKFYWDKHNLNHLDVICWSGNLEVTIGYPNPGQFDVAIGSFQVNQGLHSAHLSCSDLTATFRQLHIFFDGSISPNAWSSQDTGVVGALAFACVGGPVAQEATEKLLTEADAICRLHGWLKVDFCFKVFSLNIIITYSWYC